MAVIENARDDMTKEINNEMSGTGLRVTSTGVGFFGKVGAAILSFVMATTAFVSAARATSDEEALAALNGMLVASNESNPLIIESLCDLYNGMLYRPDDIAFTEKLGIAYDRVDEISVGALSLLQKDIDDGWFEAEAQWYSEVFGFDHSKQSLENEFYLGYISVGARKTTCLAKAMIEQTIGRRGDISTVAFRSSGPIGDLLCVDYASGGKSTNIFVYGKFQQHPVLRISLRQVADLLYPNQDELTLEEFTTVISLSYFTAVEKFDKVFNNELSRNFVSDIEFSEETLSRIQTSLE